MLIRELDGLRPFLCLQRFYVFGFNFVEGFAVLWLRCFYGWRRF